MEQERSELHSDSVGDSADAHKVFVFNCPYLGTLEDSETSLAYPASANYCFRVESPLEVDFSHQEAYCLTDQHPGCHVFQMASAAIDDAVQVAPPMAPEKRKRRVSLYALPLILILILLAAIIWWPAPGTTIQESLVLGAQNNRVVSDGATFNGKPVSEPVVAEEAIVVDSSEAVAESAVSVTLNEYDSQTEESGPDTAANNSVTNNTVDNAEIHFPHGTGKVAAPDQPAGYVRTREIDEDSQAAAAQSTDAEKAVEAEISSMETSSDNAKQDASDNAEQDASDNAEQDASEETSDTAVDSASSTAEDTSSTGDESVSDEVSEATGEKNANEEDSAEEVDEVDESPPVTTADLPIISADTPAVTTAPEESLIPNADGELIFLVGPAVSSALSLSDGSEDTNALMVHQDPTSDSALLSLIEEKQFVTLLGRDSSGSWLNVLLNDGIEGWINANQSGAGVESTSLPSEGEEQLFPAVTSFPVIRSAYVDTGALNVRSGPGVEYEGITIITSGEVVGLIGRRALGPWVRIRLDNGLEGWVNSSLLAPVS